MPLNHQLVCALAALSLTACGGGGGGNSFTSLGGEGSVSALSATSGFATPTSSFNGTTFAGTARANAASNVRFDIGGNVTSGNFSYGSKDVTLTIVDDDTIRMTIGGRTFNLERDPFFPEDFESTGGPGFASLTEVANLEFARVFYGGGAVDNSSVVGVIGAYGFVTDPATVEARIDGSATYNGIMYLSAISEGGTDGEVQGAMQLTVNFGPDTATGSANLESSFGDNSLGLGGANETVEVIIAGDLSGNRIDGVIGVGDPSELASTNLTSLDLDGTFFGDNLQEVAGSVGGVGQSNNGEGRVFYLGAFGANQP